jgi:hypothetical protein
MSDKYIIRLDYEDARLFINWDLPDGNFTQTPSRLIHQFQFGSNPDLLVEYLVTQADGKLTLRKDLNEAGIMTSRTLDFTRVFMEQANFNQLLKRLFVKQLSPSAIRLETRSQIKETDPYRLDAYLSRLKHSSKARHKKSTHFRIPDVTD